ncbi:MAG: hypothetical protein NUV53_02005 [Patescibacteria group bacterium]|nr:hypothetical protein [Patescibacteria group bacterium]
MKRILGIIVISAFLGMAVFGALAMVNHDGYGKCLVETATGGTICPEAVGSVGMATFHLNILKSFSTIHVIGWIGLLMLLAVVFSIAWSGSASIFSFFDSGYRTTDASRGDRPHAVRFYRWLALRERRIPSLI